MAYREHRVAPGIELWRSTGQVGAQRILPDGALDLLLVEDRLVVAGPDPTARVHVTPSAVPVLGVRLHGGRGARLLGSPADELTGRVLPLADLWGCRRTRALADRVLEDPAGALASWARSAQPDPFGTRLRALLASGRSVAQVADELGCSTRQLQRRTLLLFGYGPRHLARVLRLQRAVGLADRGLGWARAAADAGYADQSHLVRDVRDLTGVTPTRLRAERQDAGTGLDVRSVQDGAGRGSLAWPP